MQLHSQNKLPTNKHVPNFDRSGARLMTVLSSIPQTARSDHVECKYSAFACFKGSRTDVLEDL